MAPSQAYYQRPGHFVATCIVLAVLDILAVGLRFWTRYHEKQPRKMDDWLILPAVVLSVGGSIVLVYAVSQEALAYPTKFPEGFSGNPLLLETNQLNLLSQVEFAYKVIATLILGCTKASFLFFCLRIFSVNKKSKTILCGAIALVATWAIGFFFAMLFQCRVSFWALTGTVFDILEQCVNTSALALSYVYIDFLLDFGIIILPIPFIWQLHLSTPKKIASSIVFLLGGVAAAASLVRLIIITKARIQGFAPDADQVLSITLDLYWFVVECSVGILAVCLPTIRCLAAVYQIKGPVWQSVLSTSRSLLRTRASSSRLDDNSNNGSYVNEASDVGRKSSSTTYSNRKVRLPRKASQEPVPSVETYALSNIKVSEAV
ncbi:plasma membrane protein Pth11-like protein [Hypoxylon fuscum]|nr:plasma membrane protein Pth11-like protein [Hypoxylon fuscum]